MVRINPRENLATNNFWDSTKVTKPRNGQILKRTQLEYYCYHNKKKNYSSRENKCNTVSTKYRRWRSSHYRDGKKELWICFSWYRKCYSFYVYQFKTAREQLILYFYIIPMEVFVRKWSSSDITQGANSYPIYYKTSFLVSMFLLAWITLGISGYFFWDMLPANTTISNITDSLTKMSKKWEISNMYWLWWLIFLCLLVMFQMLFFFFKNRTPQCTLSAYGITFRDGILLPWEDITENIYTEYDQIQYKGANGILIRSKDRKWGIKWPSINAKEYISLCDHYASNKSK